MSSNLTEKLVVSIILDNSYVLESLGLCDRLKSFLEALKTYTESTPDSDRLDIQIERFDGLHSATVKRFDEVTFDTDIACQGFPLLDRTLSKSLDDLATHLNQLNTAKQPIYKPWFVIVSSGLSYDALAAFKDANIMNQINQLTVFPFLMDDTFLGENLIPMNRLKPFMVIKEHQLNALAKWLEMMMSERLGKSASEKMRLDKDSLKDWIYL